MDYQPTCGCPIPVINPPDLGIGERIPAIFARSPLPLPDPANPGAGFPRVMTASAGSIQSTSLACEPAFACGGFDGRHRVGPPIGVRSRYGIDGLDRAEGEIASLLARIYDAAGRPVAITNAELETTTIIHDGAGRPTTVIDPLGHATTTVYDVAGRAIAVVDPLGRTTTTTYDKANRPIALTNARNETTTTIYDAAGRAIAVIDPLLQATTTTYDEANRPTAITNPAGETTTTVYDAAGRAIATINPLAHTVTTTYDAANRPIAVTNAESETTTTLYDAAGRSVAVINPLLYATTTDYDAANRPIAVTNAELETTTTVYDAAGRVIAVMDPLGHATTTTYDDADRPVTVTNAENETTTTVHDAAGRVIAIIDPLGRATTTSYDLAGRVIAIMDGRGHVTERIDHGDRLASGVVNRRGCLVLRIGDAYNADGLKVEADDGTEIARFVYDGNNLLQEKDDIGWVEAEFTYVPQPYAQLVSQRREGESLFHHFDGLRDTRELSDAAGVVTDEYQYDAWGELRSSTGSTANSHTFKGELLAYRNDPQAGPEQSIYSLHYRDYVASQGRLRSEDPARDDLNLYRYCHNDPVNRSDPSGLEDSSAILRERRLRHVTLGELDGWMEALSNKQIRSLKEAALAYDPPTNVARTYSNIRSLVEYHIGGGNQPELTVEELHDVFRAWNLIRWHDPIDWENPLQAFHSRRLSNGNYALTITPPKQPNISLEDARRDVLFQLIRLDAESLASYVEREQGLRHGIAGRVDRILAERAGRTALDVAGVVAEPVDWINTGVGIAEEPANPGSYVGLLPFVPGGARRLTKKADEAGFPSGWRPLTVDDVPLPPKVRATFRGGNAVGKVLDVDTIFYRVYGEEAARTGKYMTRDRPKSPAQAIRKLALNPDWSNSGAHLVEVHVPRGTVIWEGFARRQGRLRGGGNQIWISPEQLGDHWFKTIPWEK